MKLSLAVALDDNKLIGGEIGMPWSVPEDLAIFRAVSIGRPVIYGRKTYAQIGRPFARRINIVLSRQQQHTCPGVLDASSIEEAICLARQWSQILFTDEVIVAGGGQVYAALLPIADRMYVTEIVGKFDGDVYFPEYDKSEWITSERSDLLLSKSGIHYRTSRLERVFKPTSRT